jgi:hypothetical protein
MTGGLRAAATMPALAAGGSIAAGAVAAEPKPVAEPKPAATDAKKAAPNSFGIKPEWVSSPAMLAALERLHAAGMVDGRRGSLTFFRWSDAKPPRLAHIGLWGESIDNELLGLASQLADLEFASLYETAVDDYGLAQLARLPKLRCLTVAPVCRYEKAGFGPPQWSHPFLPTRDERPRITAGGLAALGSVATLEGLHLLDARFGLADLAVLRSWPRLSQVGFTDADRRRGRAAPRSVPAAQSARARLPRNRGR